MIKELMARLECDTRIELAHELGLTDGAMRAAVRGDKTHSGPVGREKTPQYLSRTRSRRRLLVLRSSLIHRSQFELHQVLSSARSAAAKPESVVNSMPIAPAALDWNARANAS